MTWQEEAACRGKDNALFFPTTGGKTRAARAFCDACPVEQECLEFALTERIWHGVWGNTSESERRKLDHNKIVMPYRGPGRPQLTYTDCLYADTANCGSRWGYQKGCRGEHCLARERAHSTEKRLKKKASQAHEHQPGQDHSRDQTERSSR